MILGACGGTAGGAQTYFWHCAQEQLLAGLRGSYGVLGFHARQEPCQLYYLSSPRPFNIFQQLFWHILNAVRR